MFTCFCVVPYIVVVTLSVFNSNCLSDRNLNRQAEADPTQVCTSAFVFVQRLGINTFRMFTAASASAVKGLIGDANRYGQDLRGRYVTNAAQYEAAVALIRTPQGQYQPRAPLLRVGL